MLVVRNLTKTFVRDGRARTLFRDLSFDLPPGARLAIMGRNGQGKSTLIKILGGVLWSTAGTVRWDMSSSWPLGFANVFQGGMTGLDNIRFLARIYQRPIAELVDRVDRFADLGDALKMPVRYYSSGMRARLAFGLSLAFEFDCYLIDELVAVGDAVFRQRCETELFDKRKDRAFVIASHVPGFIKQTCDRAIIIENGRAKMFDDIDMALEIYDAICSERVALSEMADGDLVN